MRLAAIGYCIVSLLVGLIHGPFLHVHLAGDDSHGLTPNGQMHSHFTQDVDLIHSKTASDSDAFEIEVPHKRHRGTSVDAFVMTQICQVVLIFTQIREIPDLAYTAVSNGFVFVQETRSHDPPDIKTTAPRAPPA
jgi:hypothetical protein